jgi:hypothetical protein
MIPAICQFPFLCWIVDMEDQRACGIALAPSRDVSSTSSCSFQGQDHASHQFGLVHIFKYLENGQPRQEREGEAKAFES